MFKCTYLFENICQLYSKQCLEHDCNLFNNCGGCKYRSIPSGNKPCSNCEIKTKYGFKK